MGVVVVLIVIGFSGHDSFSPQNLTPPFNVNQVIEQVSHQQTTSGEFLLDTNVIYMPAPFIQKAPAIAFDGTNYLVVWQSEDAYYYDRIYGARVTSSGTILDAIGMAISTVEGSAGQAHPSVTFDGSNYLVVWEDWRNGYTDIYGSRVSPAGIVLDPAGIAISTAEGYQWWPSVVFDGSNYLVVWQDDRNGDWNIYGARLAPSGTILDTEGIAISTATNNQNYPSVAFDGTNYLVVWEDSRSDSADIYGTRVSQSGMVLDPSGIPIVTAAHEQLKPAVASDGTNYLIVWSDRRNGSANIYGSRMSQSGSVLEPNGFSVSTAPDWQMYPSVAFDGTNYLVVWGNGPKTSDYWDICGTRITSSGAILDSNGLTISSAVCSRLEYWSSSIAFNGINYLVVWNNNRNGPDIYGARVSPSGSILDPNGTIISTAVNSQENPSVTYDGTNYLVVWVDRRNDYYHGYFDIYGTRVSQTGSTLDPNDIAITTAPYEQNSASVAFDGTNYLVVWHDYRKGDYSDVDIYGTRISKSNTVLDPDGLIISDNYSSQYFPAVAYDGTNYLVVWRYYAQINGAQVNQAGSVFDLSGIAISAPWREDPISIAFDGSNYLVVWANPFEGIYGSRIAPSGSVLDSNSLTISAGNGNPSVAFDGTNYLVVWGEEHGTHGSRITPSGTVLEPNGFAVSTTASASTVVAFDGTNYLVVWQDNRNDDWDINGARVSPSGVVIDSFPVCAQPGDQVEPAIARGPGNQLLIVWSGWTPTINGKPANTMRIWGKFYPFTGIEESEDGRRKTEDVLTVTPSLFNKVVGIRFQGTVNEKTTLKIYDISGRCVKTFLVSQSRESKVQSLTWSGSDDSGLKLPAGIYFCRLESEDTKITKKVVKLQ